MEITGSERCMEDRVFISLVVEATDEYEQVLMLESCSFAVVAIFTFGAQ